MAYKAQRALRIDDFIHSLSNESIDILFSNYGDSELSGTINKKEELTKIFKNKPEESIQKINDIANEKYHHNLTKACIKHKVDFEYSEMTAIDLSLRLFFLYEEAFKDAFNLCHIDEIDTFKEYKGDSPVQPNNKNCDYMLRQLEATLTNLGKGKKASAEIYTFPDKLTYIIKYGDVKKDVDVLDDMTFKKIKQRLAKLIILVLNPEQKKLKVHASNNNIREKAVHLFAEHILENKDYFKNAQYAKYYDLSKVFDLTEENLSLNPAEVEYVRITELTAKDCTRNEAQIIYKSDDVLKQILDRGDKTELLIPEKVKISFKLKGYGRQNKRTIEINNRITNLNDSPRDEFIQKLLVDWGIIIVE